MNMAAARSHAATNGENRGLEELRSAFHQFHAVLNATTIPTPEGGRKVLLGAHAIALSEEAERLNKQLFSVHRGLMADYAEVVSESEGVQISAMGIGGDAANAKLVAAMESTQLVVAFPARRWNELQAANPGGDHRRYRSGDVISEHDLAMLESAARLLDLMVPLPGPCPTGDGVANEAAGENATSNSVVLDGWTAAQLIKMVCDANHDLSDGTFLRIRDAVKITKSKAGGAGAQRRYTETELACMVVVARNSAKALWKAASEVWQDRVDPVLLSEISDRLTHQSTRH